MINNELTYEEIIENIQFDDAVCLINKKTGLYINGFVREFFFSEDTEPDNRKFYISIYCFNTRLETLFILDKEVFLVPLEESEFDEYIEYDDFATIEIKDKNKIYNKIYEFIIKIVLIVVIFSLLTPSFDLSGLFTKIDFTYNNFIKNKYSLEELSAVVKNRIKYVKDYEEVWHKPDFAWKNRFGDCEEYAAIITDYLNKNGHEAYIATITLKKGGGHAFTLLKDNNFYYIIDPLRSAEINGIKRYSEKHSLVDVFNSYSSSTPLFYRVPKWNSDKHQIEIRLK